MVNKALRKSSKVDTDTTKGDNQPPLGINSFADRLRARATELGWNQAEISRQSGISTKSIGSYWHGHKIIGTDNLFALADALKVSPRWLVLGESEPVIGSPDGGLADSSSVDFVWVPRFDLRTVGGENPPKKIDSIPIRRDWLYRSLRRSSGLWLAEMPTDVLPEVAREGDTIVCEDAGPDIIEGKVYVFIRDGAIFVRRISISAEGYLLTASEPSTPPISIPYRRDEPAPDEQFIPIARVLASYTVHPV